jgi:mRNA interferase RelE/StbE
MAWQIEFDPRADRDLDRLHPQEKRRIVNFLQQRLALNDDPRSLGKPLSGSALGSLWSYRVGDYRILASIEDREIKILVVKIGNRRDVYRR